MARQPEGTLHDYADQLTFVRNLKWSAERLRQIPLHRRQNFEEPFISLPLDGLAHPEAVPGLYVYRSDVAPEIWRDMVAASASGGPSGREPTEGMHGPDKDRLDDISPRY